MTEYASDCNSCDYLDSKISGNLRSILKISFGWCIKLNMWVETKNPACQPNPAGKEG